VAKSGQSGRPGSEFILKIIKVAESHLFNDEESSLIRSCLLAEDVLVYPTDTLYGLGVDARSQKAVAALYLLKERQETPISVLLPNVDELLKMAHNLSQRGTELIKSFLPGALTVICTTDYPFAPQLVSQKGTVGFRVPADGLSTQIPEILEGPITTTSVNPAGRPPALTRSQVETYFSDRVQLMLDSGSFPSSPGSTVIDLTTQPFTILREGEITRHDLEDFLN